jgi:hypothetical protein
MNEKKKAAAIAAVIDYIKTEEEAVMMQSAQVPPEPEKAVPAPPAGLWGISGRQDLMQMRNLMQLKAFHGIR